MRSILYKSTILILSLSFFIACDESQIIEPGYEVPVWSKNVYPEKEWQQASPEHYGYKKELTDELTSYIETNMTTTGLIVTVGGKTIYEYGNVEANDYYIASVRKSIMSMMYGKYVEDGTIDLNLTLNDLSIDDRLGLLPIEKEATVLNCITARSGVYHPASNSGDDSALAPERGSQQPGTYFLYNNWDFNIAGTIFEQLTGQNVYDAFEKDFAKPLMFQDWDRSIQVKGPTDGRESMHAAYHFYLSTRDMARLGYLMLRNGKWNDRQVISTDWLRKITSAYTPVEEMNPISKRTQSFGYGYMWWVWDGNANRGMYKDAICAIGAGGQFITILPALDMVIAQKTTTADNSSDAYWTLLQMIGNHQIVPNYLN